MFPTTRNVPGHQLANGRKNELVLSWSQATSRRYAACTTKRKTSSPSRMNRRMMTIETKDKDKENKIQN